MIFVFCLKNHNSLGVRSLEDPVMVLIHQLRALGHVAELSKDQVATSRDAINVLVEGFTKETPGQLAFLRKRGARFLCIATEEPTDQGFNHGVTPHMVDRQAAFPEAAKHIEAVWALVPGAEAWYGRYAPACHVELGYAPTLERRFDVLISHEFGFFGSVTERRFDILKRLGAMTKKTHNGVKVLAGFQEQVYRDREMSRAKVIVLLRAVEEMGLVSSSRINTALHIGRPVVAEPHQLSANWQDIIHFSRSLPRFYEDAMAMRRGWEHKHAKQMARFRDLLSPERCVGRALRETDLLARLAA